MKLCNFCNHRYAASDWVCPQCNSLPPDHRGFLSFIDEDTLACESFTPEYFPRLFDLEAGSFWFKHRTRLILRAMARYFPASEDVLEIGCGTGFVLAEIRKLYPGMRLTGSDLFVEGLSFAFNRVPDAAFYQMDACRMPFEREFDLILALDVLEHIKEDVRALGEIFRSLKPGGGVIVTVPQHGWLWSIQDEKACHRRRYTREDLVGKMMASGFRITHVTSFVTLLLPMMFLSRMYGQFSTNGQSEYDPTRELKINPWANHFLKSVCWMEELILKSGVSFPTGGSLLCIGLKEH